jgi:hypothetical protein
MLAGSADGGSNFIGCFGAHDHRWQMIDRAVPHTPLLSIRITSQNTPLGQLRSDGVFQMNESTRF